MKVFTDSYAQCNVLVCVLSLLAEFYFYLFFIFFYLADPIFRMVMHIYFIDKIKNKV